MSLSYVGPRERRWMLVGALAFGGSAAGGLGCGAGAETGGGGTASTGTSMGTNAGGAGGGGGSAPIGPYACTATKGTSGTLLKGRVLAPSGPLDGEILVDAAGKIACVDATCASSAGYAAATVIECTGGVFSPSLVNAHDHTNFNVRGPLTHGNTRWDHRNGWRTGTGGEMPLPKVSATTDNKIIAAAELRYVLGGATTVLSSGGVSGLVRNVAAFKNPEQLEGLTGKTSFFDTFPLGDSNGTEIASGCAYPSIRSAGAAFADGTYAPHVAEGINAAAENEFECLKGTLITNRTAIIHGVGLNGTDVDVIRQKQASVIWSPRSNMDLYGNTAPVTELKDAGVTISLGTDWLPSGSMNMLRELACADSLNQKYFGKAFSDQELWLMATKNGAAASGFAGQIGELAVGQFADIALFDASTQGDYRAVITAGVEDVHLVLRGGKALYGDDALVSALAASCSALDVCGQPKLVCLDTPNVTFADVQAAATNSYPLFFCKAAAPTNEPSCVPYRDTYPDGTSATDRDGDGVPDASDDCPDVFNPPRPMDGTAQSDVDADGFGDACDQKALDPGAH